VTPVEAAVLRRKLEHIITCLDNIRVIARMTPEDYAAPGHLIERKAGERMLQEAIEAALDINAHLIAGIGAELPADYHGGFTMLGRLDVIPVSLASELAPSAGLRNRLVHEYEWLDDAKVFASIGVILHLYPQYIHSIEQYLEKQGL
jgi:uncharacterized protein YutE (UPF0331/DUF86 family)